MPTQEIIQNLKKEESDIEKKNESQIKEEFSNHEKFSIFLFSFSQFFSKKLLDFDLNIKFHENNFKNNCYIYQRNFQQFNFYQALALRFNCNFPKFETSSFPSIINFPGLNNQLIRQIVNPYYNNSFFQSQFLFHS